MLREIPHAKLLIVTRAQLSHRLLSSTVGAVWVVAAVTVCWLVSATAIEQRPVVAASGVVAAGGFAAAAVVLWNEPNQRGNALLFVLITVAQIVSRTPTGNFGIWVPITYALASQVEVLTAAALLRFPSDRLEQPYRAVIQWSIVLAVVFQVWVMLAGDPRGDGHSLDHWPGVWRHVPDWTGTLAYVARETWGAAAAVLFVVLLVHRWRRLAPLERHTLWPVMAMAIALGASILLYPLERSLSKWPWLHTIAGSAPAYLAAGLGAAFLAAAIGLRLARASLLTLVTQLRRDSGPGDVEGALQSTLRDPGLHVLYHVDDRRGWLDKDGRPPPSPWEIRPPTGRTVIGVAAGDGSALAMVAVDERLGRFRTLVDAAVQIVGFALETARLEAGLRAQLHATEAARARLLTTAVAERKQLERDLHDGAQQRLLALGLGLGALQASTDPATAARLADLRTELHVALDELRDLARGIYPAVLAQSGLAPALEAVVNRLPLPVDADVTRHRFRQDVESAAYFVACEALANAVRHSRAERLELTVAETRSASGRGRELLVRVRDDGIGSAELSEPDALPRLRDRITALGGDLTIGSQGCRPGGGTTLEARLPCA